MTLAGTTLTAGGGCGGYFNSLTNACGGTFSGGDGGVTGETGTGSIATPTDSGGGGGGAVGGGTVTRGTTYGDNGAQSLDAFGLFAGLGVLGVPTTSPGVGSTGGGSTPDQDNGGSATGFGCGGGCN